MVGANPISDERRRLLTAVNELGYSWHGAGSVGPAVFEALARLCPPDGFRNSLETGCGRTTLLLSHLSRRHTVFTFTNSDTHYKPDDSYAQTQASALLNAGTTRFVLGPTQRTLPQFQFEPTYDFVLLDGPHSYPFVELEYFYVYPHLAAGGVLVLDDIHIPTVHNMYSFLREDDMFRPAGVVDTTAFFVRTDAPLFNPYGDDWAAQKYNARRFPVRAAPAEPTRPPVGLLRRVAGRVLPEPAKAVVRKLLGRRR